VKKALLFDVGAPDLIVASEGAGDSLFGLLIAARSGIASWIALFQHAEARVIIGPWPTGCD